MKRASATLVLLGALLCAAVLLHCGASEVVGRGGSEVVGKLVKVVNGDTIPAVGATVSVYKDLFDTTKAPLDTEKTDKNGTFVVHFDKPGNYFFYGRYSSKDTLLVAYIPDITISPDSIADDKHDPYSKNIGPHTLLPPGSVSGRVTVYSGENSLILVDIPSLSYQTHTDTGGSFKISGIPPGTYPIRFSKDNFTPVTIYGITIKSGRDTALAPIELKLDSTKPPPAPLGLTAMPDTKHGTVILRWNSVPLTSIYSYIISRGERLPPVVFDSVLAPDTFYVDTVYRPNDTASKAVTYTIKSKDKWSVVSMEASKVTVNVVPPFTVTPVFQSYPQDTIVDFNGTVKSVCRVYCRVDFKIFLKQPGTTSWTAIPYDSFGRAPITFTTGTSSKWGMVTIKAASAADTIDTTFKVRIRPRAVTIISADSTDSSVTVRWNRSPDSDFLNYILRWRLPSASSDSLYTLSRVADTVRTIKTRLNGNIRFTVMVNDSEGLASAVSSPKSVAIINTPPRFSVDTSKLDHSINLRNQSTFVLKASDVNGDNLFYYLTTPLSGLTVQNGSVQFLPDTIDLLGPHRVVILVKDQHGGVDSLVWNVKVVAQDIWIQGKPMINPRSLFGAVTLNGQIYAIGGQAISLDTKDFIALGAVEAYDTATKSWVPKGSLVTARYAPMVAVWNNKIYAIGGASQLSYITSIEEYNPATNTWSIIGKIPFSRANGAACVIGNNLYCIGGKAYDVATKTSVIVKSIDVFNLNSRTWSKGPLMNYARIDHGVCVNNGLAYIVGGTGTAGDSVNWLSDCDILNSIEVFNPAGAGQCDSLMVLKNVRSHLGCTSLNNRIYCIGGYKDKIQSDVLPVEIVNVSQKISTLTTSYTENRYDHQSVELGGSIYCIGGTLGAEASTRSMMIYYP